MNEQTRTDVPTHAQERSTEAPHMRVTQHIRDKLFARNDVARCRWGERVWPE